MISRRNFLKGAIAAVCGCQLGSLRLSFAAQGCGGASEKVLKLFNIHTGERLHARYWMGEEYLHHEVNRIHHFLRCHYTNRVKPMSIEVIDLLWEVKNVFAHDKEIKIISGYRSPEYNEHLRKLGRKVMEGSLHLDGRAIDFAIPGIRTEKVAQAAIRLQSGGVGLYEDFVHIDVGRVRWW